MLTNTRILNNIGLRQVTFYSNTSNNYWNLSCANDVLTLQYNPNNTPNIPNWSESVTPTSNSITKTWSYTSADDSLSSNVLKIAITGNNSNVAITSNNTLLTSDLFTISTSNTTINSNTTITGNVTINGISTFNGNVTVNGAFTSNDTFLIRGTSFPSVNSTGATQKYIKIKDGSNTYAILLYDYVSG